MIRRLGFYRAEVGETQGGDSLASAQRLLAWRLSMRRFVGLLNSQPSTINPIWLGQGAGERSSYCWAVYDSHAVFSQPICFAPPHRDTPWQPTFRAASGCAELWRYLSPSASICG